MDVGSQKMSNINCKHCGKESTELDLILKLGGALCPHCRTILYLPFEKEYNDLVKSRDRENEDETK